MVVMEIDKAHQEAMNRAFQQQRLERCRPDDSTRPLSLMVGVETEYILIDDQDGPISEHTRNAILDALEHSSPELGASTVETHTRPVPVAGDSHSLLAEARQIEHDTLAVARANGCTLVRIGTYPGAFTNLVVTQEPPRYQQLLNKSHALHGDLDGSNRRVQVGSIALPPQRCEAMCGCQSVHMNIQVPAGQRAITLLNKAIEMVPYLVALTVNSPLMDNRPSGYKELRTALWEPLFTFPHIDAQYGVNTQRVGFPPDYYTDWEVYWEDVRSKLYMADSPDNAFDSNMKEFWRTVRIKPCPGKVHDCLLELRAFSPQPTVEEDVALYLLIYGLLLSEDWRERELLPMRFVEANIDQASRYGLGAALYARDTRGEVLQRPASTIVEALLDKAARVWRRRAPDALEVLDLLRARLLPTHNTPAMHSLRLFEHTLATGGTADDAARVVMRSRVVA